MEFILNTLSRAIETRSVHLKRKLLADYEHLYRHNGEGMRSFINRYQRSERALLSVNIMVEKMYDGEARGARMLERTKLPVEMQRQVLIGTMQSLEFDTVKDALLFQYPDHRAAPPLFGQHHGAPHHRQPFKGRGKGKDKGAGKGDGNKGKSQAWITDYTNDEQDYQQTDQEYEPNADDSLDIIYEDGPEEDPEDADQEGELDDDQDFDPEEISQILTVTARKLAGMTQARKFRNTGPGNKRSIADRKKSSHCAACGQPGHWKGDPECGASGGASSSTPRHAKGKGGGKDGGKEGKVAKVHFTRLRPGHDLLDEQPDQHTSHQVYTISLPPVQHHNMQVGLTGAPQAAGYVILDTACQRLCAGKEWSQAHATKLSRHRAEAFQVERNEVFEFGSGPPLTSTVTWGIPATFAHNLCILFPCILEAPIPCLASRSLLSTLQAVIDLGRNEVYFGALNATATLHMVNGHIAINILEFTWRDPKLAWWRNYHHDLPRRFGHGELGDEVYVPELTCAQAQIPGPTHATDPNRPLPPPWLQKWRHIVRTTIIWSRRAQRFLRTPITPSPSTATSSSIIPAGAYPKTRPTATRPSAPTASSTETSAYALTDPNNQCTRRYFRRSGNRHGKYAQCQECLRKWRWNSTHGGWEAFTPASRSSPLMPLPSSTNVLDSSWRSHLQDDIPPLPLQEQRQMPLPTQRRPASTSSKARPKPKTSASPWALLEETRRRALEQPVETETELGDLDEFDLVEFDWENADG